MFIYIIIMYIYVCTYIYIYIYICAGTFVLHYTKQKLRVLFWSLYYAIFVQKRKLTRNKTRLQSWVWLPSVPSVGLVTYTGCRTLAVFYHLNILS